MMKLESATLLKDIGQIEDVLKMLKSDKQWNDTAIKRKNENDVIEQLSRSRYGKFKKR